MAITITADNYPALAADAGAGVSGKRQVIYLNYGENATPEAPVWTLLGGVSSQSLSISGNIQSVQTKETGYWAGGVMTSKTAELSADIVMKRDNEAQEAIEAFMFDDDITAAKNALMVAIVDLDTKDYYQMWIIPSSWEITADSEDMIQKNLSATVIGEPEKKTGFTV